MRLPSVVLLDTAILILEQLAALLIMTVSVIDPVLLRQIRNHLQQHQRCHPIHSHTINNSRMSQRLLPPLLPLWYPIGHQCLPTPSTREPKIFQCHILVHHHHKLNTPMHHQRSLHLQHHRMHHTQCTMEADWQCQSHEL